MMTDAAANESGAKFDVCLTWNGGGGRVIATYTVLAEGPASIDSDEVRGKAISLVQCRVNAGAPERNLDALPKLIQEEVKSLLGKCFVIPRGVQLGGVMFIERP